MAAALQKKKDWVTSHAFLMRVGLSNTFLFVLEVNLFTSYAMSLYLYSKKGIQSEETLCNETFNLWSMKSLTSMAGWLEC